MLAYIAGPMTGLDDYNIPAFIEAGDVLLSESFEIVSPVTLFGNDTSLPVKTYLRKELAVLFDVDAVFVLDGWEHSNGANLEVLLALSIGVPVWTFSRKQDGSRTQITKARLMPWDGSPPA
jgi:hypothetical protein